jgi:hypothetical protein
MASDTKGLIDDFGPLHYISSSRESSEREIPY